MAKKPVPKTPAKPPPETIGARIRRLREAAGLSPGELALAIGSPTGRQIVHSWESERSEPMARWIMPLARALGVSAEELLEGA